jgi:hypothetical protein
VLAMGNALTRNLQRPRVQKIIDKVFYETAEIDADQPNGVKTVNFAELYIAVLLVYNEINKVVRRVHSDPPTKQEVHRMLEVK